jgi:uroporphyrinogen decarboxylase
LKIAEENLELEAGFQQTNEAAYHLADAVLEGRHMTRAEPIKRDLVLDVISRRGKCHHTPHMIQCQSGMEKALTGFYGTTSLESVFDNAVVWIRDTLELDTMQELGLLVNGEYTDDWGVRWQGVGETVGQVKVPPLSRPTLSGYRFPEVTSPSVLEHMKTRTAQNPSRYRIARLGGLWERAMSLRGMKHLLIDLFLNPAFVDELLDGITAYLLRNLELYERELNVDCIVLSDDYGCQDRLMISPGVWRKLIRPRLRFICETAHRAQFRFALHSDGAIGEIIPDMVDLGVDILHPVQSECVDVLWVKREFGHSLTLFGGYGNQGTLIFGTPAQVKREINQLCDALGGDGGFILTPGLGLLNETPLENAVALIETANMRQKGCSPCC